MTQRLEDMDEQELGRYFRCLGETVGQLLPDDAAGFLVLVCQDNGITQYVSSLERESGIGILRELADRLESHDTTERKDPNA